MSVTDFFTKTISLKRRSTVNDYGEFSYSSPVSIQCRMQEELSIGDPQAVRATIYIGPSVAISLEDKVTILSEDFRVVSIREYFDFDGNIEYKKVSITGKL